MSLKVRYYSPRIELYRQIANQELTALTTDKLEVSFFYRNTSFTLAEYLTFQTFCVCNGKVIASLKALDACAAHSNNTW